MNPANTVLDRCGSTNTEARALGEAGYPHGTWISTRIQDAGRGRLGRQWESLEGNLFLSMIFRIPDKNLWSWVPMATAIGAARVLREMYPKLDIRVKWPNDLWIDGAKLAGILCEAVGTRQQSFIVMGIGLNCVHAPEGLDQATAKLGAHADEVRQPVISGILEAIQMLQDRGSKSIIDAYGTLEALRAGTRISWGEGLSGKVKGLGPSGELLVEAADGSVAKLFAEDVKVRISR